MGYVGRRGTHNINITSRIPLRIDKRSRGSRAVLLGVRSPFLIDTRTHRSQNILQGFLYSVASVSTKEKLRSAQSHTRSHLSAASTLGHILEVHRGRLPGRVKGGRWQKIGRVVKKPC